MLLHSSDCPPPPTQPVSFPRLDLHALDLYFHDGSRVMLRQPGNDPLTRRVPHGDTHLDVDLRRLDAKLEKEYIQAAPIDRPAVIFFSLRHCHRNAHEFLNACAKAARRTVQ